MPPLLTRHRRPVHRVPITTLPGGARVTFHGYLPPRTCPRCARTWPAADYVKRVYTQSQRRWMRFGSECLQCEPADVIPLDLSGVRPTSTYTIDGVRVGWYQRDREHGPFGPELPLELMGLRQLADGVWRPQPKIDRRSKTDQQNRPRPIRTYAKVRDPRRSHSRDELAVVVVQQFGCCGACGKPFTEEDPAVADHDWPYADGGPTDLTNCVALHRSCNAEKGRRSLEQYKRDLQLKRGLF